MQLIRNIKKKLSASIVTIGNFDGMHKGHQQLLHVLHDESREWKLPSVLITFEPNPSEFFASKKPAARLMRFSEKWRAMKKFQLDHFYQMRFDKALADLSAEDFVKNILVDQLHAKKIVVGDDFRFGAKRVGDVALLKKLGDQLGFEVDALPQSNFHHERISSTRVRNALQTADFETAKHLLGAPFTLSGKVSYGDQIGRTLGFPTANIHLHRKQVPLMGIFVVRVHGLHHKIFNGVASIGYRPTFNGKKIILEVFLFDFDEMIYGRHLTVEFLHKIRDEVKFDSVDALVMQIQNDVDIAKQYFISLG